jgi:hypothetical protein
MTKVFVFAYNRYDTMTTSMMLEADGVEHTVLCHLPADAEKFAAGNRVYPERLVVTGQPKGLANNRNYALDMMEEGEWALFLVDDLMDVTELDDYDTEDRPNLPFMFDEVAAYRLKFKKPISTADLLRRAEETIPTLEEMGCALLGWAGNENPLFRRRKLSTNALPDGRAWLVKKTHLRFDDNAQLIDDLCWAAKNIQEFGIVLVDKWILPRCKRYTAGGYGGMDERMEQKLREAKYLVDTYPDFVKFSAKKGWPENSHVRFRGDIKKHIKTR